MGNVNRGPLVIKTLASLVANEELTASELAVELGVSRYDAHAVLSRMAKRTKAGLKRIHIRRWIFDHEGARRYPRAVFAVGDREDAEKPRSRPKDIKRRYESKRKLKINSVFMLGMTREQRRQKS